MPEETKPCVLEFKLNYRWIVSYKNGLTVTSETHQESFVSREYLDLRLKELQAKKSPSSEMKLEYIGWRVTTEKLKI